MLVIYTNQSEEQMRAKYESYIKSYTSIMFKRGVYMLSSYKNINVSIKKLVPDKVGVSLVNTSWFASGLSSKEGLFSTLQNNYGPRTLNFQCVWYNTDNPDEPSLDPPPDRKFAEVEYIWRYHSELPEQNVIL